MTKACWPFWLSASLLGGISAHAQSAWTGAAGTGYFSDPLNWSPLGVPANRVVTFTSLVANGQFSIDFQGPRSEAGLTFPTCDGVMGFDFSNGRLSLGSSGITSLDKATQSFAATAPIELTADQSWDAGPGALVFNGTVDLQGRRLTVTGGQTFNNKITLSAGSALVFNPPSVKGSGGPVVTADLIGQGTSLAESTVRLNTSVSFAPGAAVVVQGSGVGGLRVEGSKTRVDGLLTSQRLQDLTGTGGTLTVAYADNGTRLFSTAPTLPSQVRLGFDAVDGASPTYKLGSRTDDLGRFNGLVVKGGSVIATASQSFAGAGVSSLDLNGGTLTLGSAGIPRTLTFQGGANLNGGVLDGAITPGGAAGTLVVGGDIVSSGAVLANTPNITMNISGAAGINGATPLNGVNRLLKTGDGSVVVNNQLGANLVEVNKGSLLLGADNRIADTTRLWLSGGTFATQGHRETLGLLTLAANSRVDLGNGASVLQFADTHLVNWTGGKTLDILNWNGLYTGGGDDQLRFGSSLGTLNDEQLSQIRFINPNGVEGIFGSIQLPTGEVVPIPVPEPGTIAIGALLMGGAGWRERRRIQAWLAKRRRNEAS